MKITTKTVVFYRFVDFYRYPVITVSAIAVIAATTATIAIDHGEPPPGKQSPGEPLPGCMSPSALKRAGASIVTILVDGVNPTPQKQNLDETICAEIRR